jgi:hypothetical protein
MKTRVLVGEAVVVLPPDMRGEQVVERGNRSAPRDVPCRVDPLRVLVEHRVDDVDERLVAAEQAVPAAEQVALEPALDTFRLFGPDETESNRLGAVYEYTAKVWQAKILDTDEHLARSGRVMEVLSEHQCLTVGSVEPRVRDHA